MVESEPRYDLSTWFTLAAVWTVRFQRRWRPRPAVVFSRQLRRGAWPESPRQRLDPPRWRRPVVVFSPLQQRGE